MFEASVFKNGSRRQRFQEIIHLIAVEPHDNYEADLLCVFEVKMK
jgi:hypothetical protein